MTLSTAKHIMNSPETLVSDSLQGLCYTNPNIRLLEKERVVYYANIQEMSKNQVTLISGGGSGHEPGYANFVGSGGLAASVSGHVFSSPSSSQVLAAIERVQSPHGTLVIIMNYTGDCLNFGLAVERAKHKGIQVDLLAIEDDVAIINNQKVGRRGMAATVLAIKLAGALASRGASMDKVKEVVQYAIKNTVTLGVALDHVHVPGSSSSITSLGVDELELGMGIHNESGFLKTTIMPAKQLVSQMMDMLINKHDDPNRNFLKLPPQASVVMLVNNLGGTAMLELNVVVKEAVDYLLTTKENSIKLERVFVGPFVTSLNMQGFSITLLLLQKDRKEALLDLMDQQVSIPAWPSMPALSFSTEIIGCGDVDQQKDDAVKAIAVENIGPATDPKLLRAAIMGATQGVIEAEPKITEYDTILGDGDCGHTLKTAALAIQVALDTYDLTSASATISGIAKTIENSVGGTSCAIYCIFLNALATHLKKHDDWILATNDALHTLMGYTKARVGDRTLMDTLCPFIETLLKHQGIEEACKAAQQGCEGTCNMTAQLGRSSYLDQEDVLKSKIPDAGAYGLAELLKGLIQVISSHPTH